jgi:hypothetical protein
MINLSITIVTYTKYLIIKLSPIKIKRNNEIIIQYLIDSAVVFHESFVLGVSLLSDVMSKSADSKQDDASYVLIIFVIFSKYLPPVPVKTKCIARDTAQRIDADPGKLYGDLIALASGEKCMIST